MAETGCDWKYKIVTDFSITAARDNSVIIVCGFITSCSSNRMLLKFWYYNFFFHFKLPVLGFCHLQTHSTEIPAGIYCKRRTILQRRFVNNGSSSPTGTSGDCDLFWSYSEKEIPVVRWWPHTRGTEAHSHSKNQGSTVETIGAENNKSSLQFLIKKSSSFYIFVFSDLCIGFCVVVFLLLFFPQHHNIIWFHKELQNTFIVALKRIVRSKIKILSLFTHPDVAPNKRELLQNVPTALFQKIVWRI